MQEQLDRIEAKLDRVHETVIEHRDEEAQRITRVEARAATNRWMIGGLFVALLTLVGGWIKQLIG